MPLNRCNKNIETIPHWIVGVPHTNEERKSNMILFIGRNEKNKGIQYLNLLSSMKKYDVHCVTNSLNGISSNIKTRI